MLELASNQCQDNKSQDARQEVANLRRPSRLGSSCAPASGLQSDNSLQARLKRSTIKRVPLAKSRLGLPVAAKAKEPPSSSSSASAVGQQRAPNSRLARPTPVRPVRPTSLMLAGARASPTTTRARVKPAAGAASDLPKPTSSASKVKTPVADQSKVCAGSRGSRNTSSRQGKSSTGCLTVVRFTSFKRAVLKSITRSSLSSRRPANFPPYYNATDAYKPAFTLPATNY